MTVVTESTQEPEVIRRKIWTREECAAVVESHSADLERFELIHGELIEKVSKNRPHLLVLLLLRQWAERTFGFGYVQQEGPVDVAEQDNSTSEPEPDLAILSKPLWEFKTRNPLPVDIRLLVEISDSSLAFDLRTKAALYARAGIPEYWVVDVHGRRLIVHREPKPGGTFGSVLSYSQHEPVGPIAAPEVELRLADLFPADV
jgi:Uma2 family endonuclease